MLVPWSACGSQELPPLEVDAQPACGCELGPARLAGAVTMDGADELSGLAVSTQPDLIWAHNDGDKPELFALTATGAAKGVAQLTGALLVDPEDLAIAPCVSGQCIYLGDIGDNQQTRTSVQIYEIDEPLDFRGIVQVGFRKFDVSYPDGPHDAEALFVDPRDAASYVITKQRATPSTVFLMPRGAATTTAMAVAEFAVPGGDEQITAADLRVDECGVRLLIRTYSSIWELAAPTGTSIVELFATPATSRPVPVEAQGESVAFLASGHGYVTVTDGLDPRLSRVTCQ